MKILQYTAWLDRWICIFAGRTGLLVGSSSNASKRHDNNEHPGKTHGACGQIFSLAEMPHSISFNKYP